MIEQIRQTIRDVKDFPKPGINFKDINPLLRSAYFKEAVKLMGEMCVKPEYWVGIESRGFVFASALAMEFGGGILLCRKRNKLPPPVVSVDYELEYGHDRLEVNPGTGKVVLVDDVLATGGTLLAAESLLIKAGYTVLDRIVLINIKSLNSVPQVKSLIEY